MKVRCITDQDPYLTKDKVYEVIGSIWEDGDAEIIDDSGDKYFMFKEEYEVIEE